MSCGSTQCSQTLPFASFQAPRFQAPRLRAPRFQARGLEVSAASTGWGRLCRRLGSHLLWLHDRQLQRRLLRELDDHLLADIGITREQAEREARKPFWL